jgi:hypothetical protein
MYYAPYMYGYPYYAAPMPDFRNLLYYQNYPQGVRNLEPYYSTPYLNRQAVVGLSNHRKQPFVSNSEVASMRNKPSLSSYKEITRTV